MHGPLGPLPRNDTAFAGSAEAAKRALLERSGKKRGFKVKEQKSGELALAIDVFSEVALSFRETPEGACRVTAQGRPTRWLPGALGVALLLAAGLGFLDGFSLDFFALTGAAAMAAVYFLFYVGPIHHAQGLLEETLREAESGERPESSVSEPSAAE
jgi:hypothetical protein